VKNLDKMSEDLFDLLGNTKFKFLSSLFESDRDDAAKNRKETLGAKFAKQLNDLMVTLNATEPHYIRCVKPNKSKAPMEFNAPMVLQQLQYSGVFEAVQIRKSGYPFRYTHGDFRKRYK
jgi:myosin VIIa